MSHAPAAAPASLAPAAALWRLARPLILASASPARRLMLENAGLPVRAVASAVDERAVEAGLGPTDAAAVAGALAAAKALDVAARHAGDLVLGADQTLALDGVAFHKPTDRASARAQLAALQGRAHHLVSAYALVRDGVVLQSGAAAATLTMRPLSAAAIERYLDAAGDLVLSTVGGYHLEGLGAHLMERVEGDHFTVLGLPMLPVLAALRALGAVHG